MVAARPIVRSMPTAPAAGASDTVLQGVLDALPGIIWTALPDGQVDFLNRCWAEFTGMQAQDGLGSAWQATIHDDDLPTLRAQWQTAIESRTPFDAQARVRRSDGEFRWLQFRASPQTDAAGKLLRWCGMQIDIHDGRQPETAAEADEQQMTSNISSKKSSGVISTLAPECVDSRDRSLSLSRFVRICSFERAS